MISISSRPERAAFAGVGVERRRPRAAGRRSRSCAAARAAPPGRALRSAPVDSAPATSASGRWVVTGTVRSVGPASIIATLAGRHAAALGDELGLARDARSRSRRAAACDTGPVTTAGGRARARQPDRELERIERAMRAGDARVAGDVGLGRQQLDQRQADVEGAVGLAAGRRWSRSARPTPPRSSADRRSRRTAAGRTRPRWSQHLATTSGPIPAGSPSETASGR